jgi:hypothetical protein
MAVSEALGSKVAGHRPGRFRAAVAAAAVGMGAAVLTYRVLRSEAGSDPSSQGSEQG